MSSEQVVQIGINKLKTIGEMTKLFKLAYTKEDILFILEKMKNELADGLTEIDKINEIKEE